METQRNSPGGLSVAFQDAVALYRDTFAYLNTLPVGTGKAESDRASAAYMAADGTLLGLPAENLHDLRAKFDCVWGDAGSMPNDVTLRLIFTDIRRLTGETVSAIFNAEIWLHYFELRGGGYCLRGDEVFLLQPEGSDVADNLFELEALGGKPAVDDLIRQRTAREAAND